MDKSFFDLRSFVFVFVFLFEVLMKHSSLVLGLAFAVGCNGSSSDTPIDLEWNAGDEYHVSTKYRVGTPRTEESAVSLDGSDERHFGEQWSDDVVWTYQVVESGYVPSADDQLYTYSETREGMASLAVVRAYLDGSLNEESDLKDTEPVVYLVFREDRDRLAAVISYATIDGERVERAYSSNELGQDWSALSQSQLADAPTYLVPFGARFQDEERVLSNGSTVETVTVDNGVVDAFFSDELGGGLVATRYEEGSPWPTWTVTDNMEAILLSAGEVADRRAARPFAPSDVPENYNFRKSLETAINIDAALVLNMEDVEAGRVEASTPDEYKPWAGSWWPQSKGELVFGYRGSDYSRPIDTFSDLLREEIDPLKKSMDGLSEEIRDMEDGEEKDAKRSEYSEKQQQLVDILVKFYSGILEGLDGGTITVGDGKITRAAGEGEDAPEAFEFELNELSTYDKFSLQMYLDGNTYPNPFFLSAWELLNHYSPAGGSWWGHCNGWSAAAILTDEPTESITVPMGNEMVEYTTADLKGLLSEAHYSTRSQFYGARYYKEGDDKGDLTPKAFHKLVQFFIGTQQVPLVFDTTATEQVWNYPAYAYEMTIDETTPENAESLININSASYDALQALPGVGPVLAGRIIDEREKEGSFQSIEDIKNVNGIGDGRFQDLKDLISVRPFERTFHVMAEVLFTTDGVDEEHIDRPGQNPEGFEKRYGYTLTTDTNGVVLSGEWDDIENHPDFAWIPYENPTARARGGSENGYLPYGELLEVIGDGYIRE